MSFDRRRYVFAALSFSHSFFVRATAKSSNAPKLSPAASHFPSGEYANAHTAAVNVDDAMP
eukprot:10722-Pelagococcus_subviridis.AAC.6